MIRGRRFEILQSEAFGADTNELGELEQVELLKYQYEIVSLW